MTVTPAPGLVVDTFVEFVANNPFMAFLLALGLGVFFFLYFLVRRSLLSAKQGYEEGVRGDR
jgi:hypothetical protein